MKQYLLAQEIQELIAHLCEKANLTMPTLPLKGYQIPTRRLGFRFFPNDNDNADNINLESNKANRNLSDVSWKDSDGFPAFASLSQDLSGNFFELDIWKTNFTTPSTLSLA